MKRNALAGQATWKQQPPKHYTEKPESIKRKQQQIQKTKRELGNVSSSTSYRQEQNDILLSFRDAIHLSSLIANFRRHYCLEITIIIIFSPSLVQNIATISPLIITSYWTPTERYRLIWSSPERVIKKRNDGFYGNYSHINGFINWSHLWRESVEVKRSFNSCFRFHREMCLMLTPHSVSYFFPLVPKIQR